MKLLDRYLLKELTQTWLAVSGILLLILISNSIILILSDVADGELPQDAVLPFLLTNFIMFAVAIVPFGLYLGVMLGLGRLYKDSEMAAMAACGVGGWQIYRPVFLLSMVAVFLISFLTFWATPWAARLEQQLRAEISSRSELSGIVPGRFNAARDQATVMFVREFDAKQHAMQDVFVHGPDPEGGKGLEIAAFADRQSMEQGQYLVLHDGRRYLGIAGSAQFRIIEFERHGILIPSADSKVATEVRAGKSARELLASGDIKDRAELEWRITLPIAAFLLALIAVPLSYTTPRQGRYARLAVAILIYVPYWNLGIIAKRWLRDGVTPEWLGIWWIHLPLLLLVALLYLRRWRVRGWRRFRYLQPT